MNTIRQAAEKIAACLLSDSDVELDVDRIEKALTLDGKAPTDQIIDMLVTGDSAGWIPTCVAQNYPHTLSLIESLF